MVVNLAIDGPASGQDLAAKLRVALGTVTGIVDRLVDTDTLRQFEHVMHKLQEAALQLREPGCRVRGE